MDDDSFWETLLLPDPDLEANLLKPLPEEILTPIETLTPTSPVTTAEQPISLATDVPLPEPDTFMLSAEPDHNAPDIELLDVDLGEQYADQYATPPPLAINSHSLAPLRNNMSSVSPIEEGSLLELLNAEDFNIEDFNIEDFNIEDFNTDNFNTDNFNTDNFDVEDYGPSPYTPSTPETASHDAPVSPLFGLDSSPEPLFADDHALPDESFEAYRAYLTDIFLKMMFVSGETAEASAETTWLIEEIVREQVVHMVSSPA